MGHRQGKEREHESQSGVTNVLDQVFIGKQHIISHDGVSQYQKRHASGAGLSACGLAALNCVRLIFGKEDGGLAGEELLQWVMSREGAKEITSICDYWTKPSHLDMEDILDIPLFSKSLSLVRSPTYSSRCDLAGFTTLLQDMQNVSTTLSSAVMITKPPEIVACVKIPTARGNIFLIFDSHIRSNHPLGAGFILNSSLEGTAKYLANLFKMETMSSFNATNPFHWQLDLMRQFCGHILVSKGSSCNDSMALAQTVLESSMRILTLAAELASLKSENGLLTVQLEKASKKLSDNHISDTRRIEVPKTADTNEWTRYKYNACWLRLKLTTLTRRERKSKTPLNTVLPSSSRMLSYTRRQDEIDHALALQLQEDQRLSSEREVLSVTHPAGAAPFKCGICLQEHSEDYVARLPRCLHSFCRYCMRGYIRSKLGERRFPILCPVCIADNLCSDPGAVDNFIVMQIGIDEQEYRVFEELQISAYSVLLYCRRCQDSISVDRKEYQEASILVCPLPRCHYAWCKTCQQEVNVSGPHHSCDGSTRPDGKGWVQVLSRYVVSRSRLLLQLTYHRLSDSRSKRI
ncbi:hypothetical protein FPV67DRAFT_1406946 [Lyophyllum atratum]|nr:hypothetical protein FPV67DRAFT_1406946 [Lyophyllum atratum]